MPPALPRSLRRAVRRRRALGVAAAVAGVLGAIGGSVTAASLEDGSGREATGQTAASSGADAGPAPVLWADRTSLHDGDVTLPHRLVDPPQSVQRVADGWVLTSTTGSVGATSGAQVTVLRTDGTSDFLAEVTQVGDVSPDGTRYLAGTGDGYVEWDLATREVVQTLRGGRRAGQVPTGRARYVDGDTVATGWSDADGNRPEVVLSELGTPGRRVVADDVAGPWGIAPDGRWIVARMVMVMRDGIPTGGCTLVRALDGGAPDVEDCGGEVSDVPSFRPDSSAVLVATGDPQESVAYRLLPIGGGPETAVVSVPYGSARAVVLDQTWIAVVGAPEGGRTPVLVCAAERACEQVGSTASGPGAVVLGS